MSPSKTHSKDGGQASKLFSEIANRASQGAGRALTFVIAVGTVIVWAATGPVFHYSDTWQLVINTGTTIVTFLMVFLIQNAQNRDASAMQVKLDELIRAIESAQNGYIGIEHLTDAQICSLRDALEKEIDAVPELIAQRQVELNRLIERR